ncbi:MAG: Rieske (2Fe-2S) protein, partial [Chloroflexi bacterium]|nr:Rieske (2Fe-2S) protein [Chloroflexota bacterium]
MATATDAHIRVGTLDDLKERGCTVVTGGGHTIAVFAHGDTVYAVDNRCPHMGFPLDRGTVKDGILTCHWHHARFDLSSGGTFDPFADDVRSFPVSVDDDGTVWVDPSPPEEDQTARWSKRLQDALEDNIRLVVAKSVLGLDAAQADYRIPLGIGADFGSTYSAAGWGQAMTILTCSANMLPYLEAEDRPLAMFQGLLHVARSNAGMPPRFLLDPLPTGETRPEVFKLWFRNFIDVRDSDGAERCLRTAIELGIPEQTIADMIFSAITDHIYVDAGHTLDFANKAFEILDHLGWEHAGQVLTSLVRGMAGVRRSEELSSWRNPIDISSMTWQAREALTEAYGEGMGRRGEWDDEDALVATMLEDNPAATLDAMVNAVRRGASEAQVGSAVAYAAFMRMARFHTSNEFNDWDTLHNTLTAANALHQALMRAPSLELLRGALDTAMSVYLDRFLNMPAQRVPNPLANGAVDGDSLRSQLLDGMNRQQLVEPSAKTVSDYISGGAIPEGIIASLAHAMLREESGFHMFQIVDAAIKQYEERRGTDGGRVVLVALA